MMELYGNRDFDGGLSFSQLTPSDLGDKHHEDQATVAFDMRPEICKVFPLP
jgi:hypothetical protein